jgi:lysophospholipase L1-like esterase
MKRPNLWEYTSLIQLSSNSRHQHQSAAAAVGSDQDNDHTTNDDDNHDDGRGHDDENRSNMNLLHHKRIPTNNNDKVKVADEDLLLSNETGFNRYEGIHNPTGPCCVKSCTPQTTTSSSHHSHNLQPNTVFSYKNANASSNNNNNATTTTTQKCMNLDAIVSKKARNQTMFTITRAGTKSSRSGLYIRPSWKYVLYHHVQRRHRVYIAIIVTLLLLRPFHSFLVKKRLESTSSSSSSSSSSSMSHIDDEWLIDLGSGGYGKFPLDKDMRQEEDSLCAVYGTDSSSSSSSSSSINGYSSSGASVGSSAVQDGALASAPGSNSNTAKSFPVKCRCINPMNAKMGSFPGWNKAHEANKNMIDEYYHSQNGNKMLDVVFLGDSITEEWNGRWMGKKQGAWEDIHEEWKKLFDPSITLGALNGLALGIAGDNIANLLWRIKNGELEHVHSKVFWLLIGTNDLSLGCSDKTVLLGILHVAQEIQKQKPESIVVVNGILPRTSDESGRLGRTINGNPSDHEQFSFNGTMTTQNSSINSGDMPLKSPSVINQQRISLWQSIQSINKSLAKFAEQHDRIEYFDASDIFIARMKTKVYQRDELFLLKELQHDFLHPTALGHKLWGEAIVDYIASDLDTPENLRGRQGRRKAQISES